MKLTAVEHDVLTIATSEYIALFPAPGLNIARKIQRRFIALRLITGYIWLPLQLGFLRRNIVMSS